MTKRESIIRDWTRILNKYSQRANDSMECFRRFGDSDSLDRLIEDAEKIIENAKLTKEVIRYMDIQGVK